MEIYQCHTIYFTLKIMPDIEGHSGHTLSFIQIFNIPILLSSIQTSQLKLSQLI